MRLVSYNILDGGEGRADPLAEVLLAQRPDVVGLVEADDPAVLERIALRLRMDYIHAPGKKSASALLSRWPITYTINHALRLEAMTKALLEAGVRLPDGRELLVGVVHLHAKAHDADERVREREIAAVLQVFAEARKAGRPHVLVGDFNANSPIQRLDRKRVKPATREAMDAQDGDVPRRVVQTILDAGYVDTLAAHDANLAATAASFTTQNPGQRVDYIFAFGLGRIASAWIEQDRLARYASDHYPVGAELL